MPTATWRRRNDCKEEGAFLQLPQAVPHQGALEIVHIVTTAARWTWRMQAAV
jgi:hypothetical protein